MEQHNGGRKGGQLLCQKTFTTTTGPKWTHIPDNNLSTGLVVTGVLANVLYTGMQAHQNMNMFKNEWGRQQIITHSQIDGNCPFNVPFPPKTNTPLSLSTASQTDIVSTFQRMHFERMKLFIQGVFLTGTPIKS